jgi:hypothetical protein
VLQLSSTPNRKDRAVDTVGTARLARAIPPQRAISASISRREISTVLDDIDGIPELRLDVISVDRGERGTISMTWSRDELERLLEAASEDEVVLTFDESELSSFLGDVEAHGMRASAAVFAVAAAGALGTGAAANASIAGGDGGGTAAAPIAASADTGATAASQARSQAMNEEYGLGSAGNAAATAASQARSEAMNEEFGLGSAGNAAAANAAAQRGAAMNEEYGLGSAGNAAATAASQARSEAMNEEFGLGSAGNAAAANAAAQRGAAMNEAYGLGAAATDSRVTDASSTGGYATPVEATGGGGFDVQMPPVDDALLVGGLLLTIAGATFVVRRTSTPPLA